MSDPHSPHYDRLTLTTYQVPVKAARGYKKYITNTVNVFYGYSIAEKEHSGKSNHYDRSLTDVRDLSYDSTFPCVPIPR